MSDEMIGTFVSHILSQYGPMALPVIGLLLVIKYLLDKDKVREVIHKEELEAERDRTRSERKRGDELQAELLREARSQAMLSEELKTALQALAKGNR